MVKRKASGQTEPQCTKRVQIPSESSDVPQDINSEYTMDTQNNQEEPIQSTRRDLIKIFRALEAFLTSSLSMTSFHSVQRGVTAMSRLEFTMDHLAQICGVWPEAYVLESSMSLHNGDRVPSIAISRRGLKSRATNLADRQSIFEARLQSWQGSRGTLPTLEVKTLMPLNAAKIASMQRNRSPAKMDRPEGQGAKASERQEALLERVRAKASLQASRASDADRNNATIAALMPTVVTSIRVLLASRRSHSFGLRELVNNLTTSLSNRVGAEEVEKIVQRLAGDPVYGQWCRLGRTGSVSFVKFVGAAPSVSVG